MARNYGYEYEVSVYAYFKVAMAKRKDEEEISEEAFDATCRLYEHESDVKVLDNQVMEVEQDNKYFTVANVGLDLRINTTGFDYDDAYENAEAIAEDIIDELPAGVAYFDCEAYDAEQGEPAVDWDWACGE